MTAFKRFLIVFTALYLVVGIMFAALPGLFSGPVMFFKMLIGWPLIFIR